MKNVSKNVFLNTIVCPSLGWLLRSGEPIEKLSEGALSLGERFRIEQGAEIGERARGLYPDGALVSATMLSAAAEQTLNLVRDTSVSVLFEATFLVDEYVTKADILLRKNRGWQLIEVKSSVNDKPEFVDDLAYTAMVTNRAGLNISAASLMLISKDFRLGMGDEQLFVKINHRDEVLLRAAILEEYWDYVKGQTAAPTMPEPEVQLECKKCPLFSDCLGKGIDNHILEIPRLSQKKLDSLKQLGIVRIEDIPSTFELTPYQATVRDCVVTQKSWARKQLKEELDAITWPVFYLDFETVMTAIPLYPNIAPYTQIPTQYSIHKCSDIGKVLAHREFLCDPQKDSRKELAQNLIRDLEKTGSIITYSNFEKITVNGLAQLYPDLLDSLLLLVDRMVDLGAIIRQNFYNPGFHGSTSVKVTLPILVPEMSYDDLEIAEGDSASAAFAYLALGKYETEAEMDAVKRNLLDYCARDTIAMVRLHERLYVWE